MLYLCFKLMVSKSVKLGYRSNGELKKVDNFKNLGSAITRDGKSRWKLPWRKKQFTLDKQVRNIELKKKSVRLCLEHCFIWLRNLDTMKIGAEVFGEFWNVVLEEKGEGKMARESSEKTLLNNILRRKANWVGRNQRRNCLIMIPLKDRWRKGKE